ncbi:hypothetical protein BJV74DRAFT_862663, partial [Russula compacta]
MTMEILRCTMASVLMVGIITIRCLSGRLNHGCITHHVHVTIGLYATCATPSSTAGGPLLFLLSCPAFPAWGMGIEMRTVKCIGSEDDAGGSNEGVVWGRSDAVGRRSPKVGKRSRPEDGRCNLTSFVGIFVMGTSVAPAI